MEGQQRTCELRDELLPCPMVGQVRTLDFFDEFCWAPQSVTGQTRTMGVSIDCRAQPVQGQACLDASSAWSGDTSCDVSNFPDELGSMEGWYGASQTVWDSLSDDSSSDEEAPHVASNFWADNLNHSSRGTPAYQSETFWDQHGPRDQSEQKSSNGVGQPSRGMYVDPRRVRSPTDNAHSSRQTRGVRTEEISTLMIQNLPRRCCRATLAAEIERSGFVASFDFIYVPTMFKRDRLNGYGFVNFLNQDVAMAFKHAWNGSRRFQTCGRSIKVGVVEARIQGLQANVAKWQGKGGDAFVRVKNPNYRPLMPAAH